MKKQGLHQAMLYFLLFLLCFCFEEKPIANIQIIDQIPLRALRSRDNQISEILVQVPINKQQITILLKEEIELIKRTEIATSNRGITERKPCDSIKAYSGRIVSPVTSRSLVRLTGKYTENTFQLEGIIEFENNLYTLKKVSNYKLNRREQDENVEANDSKMVLYKTEQSGSRNLKCGHDHSAFNVLSATDQLHNFVENRLQAKATTGCPTQTKELYVGIAVDCSYFQAAGSNVDSIVDTVVSNMNIVSGIYQTFFKISIGVITLAIEQECSGSSSNKPWNRLCSASYSLDDRLNDFSRWRATQNADAGLWHLLSACPDGGVVGIAWLNQLCQTSAFQQSGDWISGTGVTTRIANEYAVIAHEIGHNFGAIHDCDSSGCSSCVGSQCPCCTCGNTCTCSGSYIMNPQSGGLAVNNFSPCTQTDVCQKIPFLGNCLANPGTRAVVTGAVCGNGILEAGEECDCGTQCASDPCCNSNCTLTSGSQCSDLNGSCCQSCTLVTLESNTKCRSGEGSCQLDTVCNGSDPGCPATTYLANGSECEFSDSKCASGLCTNRKKQCIAVGSRANIIGECKASSSCQMICESASGCFDMGTTFVDGTDCNGDGKCVKGECKGATFFGQAFDWIGRNLIISLLIGACLVVGIVAVLLSICSRRK